GRVDLLGPALLAVVEAVELEDVRRLLGDVERLGGGELHAGGQLVGADAGVESVVAGPVGGVLAVQSGGPSVAVGVAGAADEVAVLGGEQVGDRVVGAGAQDGPLVPGRQEGGVPVLGAVGGVAAVVGQDDEGRQVLVEAAQRVADPAAHAGEA